MSEKEIQTFKKMEIMDIIMFFPFLPFGDTVKALHLLFFVSKFFFHFSIMYIFLSGQENLEIKAL